MDMILQAEENQNSSSAIQPAQLAELNDKLDRLSAQVAFLAEQAEAERQQREMWADLQRDLTPIAKDIYAVAEEELAALRPHVELDDILFFMRRLARSVRTFNDMLDQLESIHDFWADAGPLSRDLMDEVTLRLDSLERKGYFGFARQSAYVVDQIVTSFSEEDVKLLGDNVVLILNTVKAMTQPEIMNLVSNLTAAFQEVEEEVEELPTSLLGILGQMRDPDVRRGLAITMAVLKRISQQQSAGRSTTVPAQSLNGKNGNK
jgi:uncharacterized protein YjgD (DUF1641 family)